MAISPLGPPRRTPEPTLYEAVGGEQFFVELVDHFYDNVEADARLLALYPDPDDLGPARERFRLFLCQYWGGPTTYSEQRGHPRLRMRHAPFVVGAEARDRWLAAMRAALDVMDVEPAIDAIMWQYFTGAAEAMRNSD
jgi:hemoglobin